MNRARFILTLSMLALSCGKAGADGGIARAREVQGPFEVTIFTASEPERDIPVDVSVLVQERESHDAILDATVKLVFTPPAGAIAEPTEQTCGAPGLAGMAPRSGRFALEATRRQASNKLLYAAPVKFSAAGSWQLQAYIKRDGVPAEIACALPVSPPPRTVIGLLPYLILPPSLVSLFALNQWLRGHANQKPKSHVVPTTHRRAAV